MSPSPAQRCANRILWFNSVLIRAVKQLVHKWRKITNLENAIHKHFPIPSEDRCHWGLIWLFWTICPWASWAATTSTAPPEHFFPSKNIQKASWGSHWGFQGILTHLGQWLCLRPHRPWIRVQMMCSEGALTPVCQALGWALCAK